MYVDEQATQRRSDVVVQIRIVQPSLEDLASQCGPALSEVQHRHGTCRIGMLAIRVQEFLRLVQASLEHAQLGQPYLDGRLQGGVAPLEQARCLVQLLVGLGPSPRRGQDAAVVGATEARHADETAPLQRLGGADPLLGPGDIVEPLTRPEQPAEGALHDVEILDLARDDSGERLVQQP